MHSPARCVHKRHRFIVLTATTPDTWWTCGRCLTRNTGSTCRICGN